MFQSYECLESNCIGIDSIAALKGSFYLVAQNIAPKNKNSYKAMIDWALDQLFAADSYYNFDKTEKESFGEVLRVFVNELIFFKRVS